LFCFVATININEFTEKQLKIPHIAESISMIPKRTTASNLSKNHNFLIKNFTTAWLGSNLTKKYDSISELYRTVNPVAVFENPDSLIQYLAQRHNRKIVLILSDYLNESNISSIHNLPQLHSIYIFCSHSDKNEEWTKQWRKVIGIFHDITSIFHELKQITREHIHDFIPSSMTSISSNTDLNACTSSFMYSQIFKEILLQMQCNEKIKQDVIDCVHTKLTDNDATLRAVDQFNQDYNSSSPIWWYTKESFLYSLLNKALRAKDNDAIVKMRYFTRDLHTRFNRFQFLPNSNGNSRFDSIIIDETEGLLGRFCKKTKRHLTIPNKLTVEVVSIYDFYQQIERLHLKKHQTVHATLYRGQAMSTWEFEKLKQRKDGLMSFNNFLSTSIDRNVSLCYAESVQSDPDLIGILFTITMNISVPSSSFTRWNRSYHGVSEEEIPFSMNSVFRIEEIECVDDHLWEVNLTLFDNYYKKCECQFNQHRQKMTSESATLRDLCLSMIDMGEFEKAEEIYKKLPETEFLNNLEELAYLYTQLGYIKNVKNDFDNALLYYQKALQILNDNHSDNHAELARLFNNIGMVHGWVGDSSTGISYLRQALDIQQKSTTLTYPDAIMIYNNIGQLYSSRAAYITSLSYFQKAIEIQQNFHVSSYPFLALTYANLGQVYYLMEDRSTALNFLQKTLEIQEQSSRFIPADRAETYNMIGSVHESMKYYTAALESFQKALRIQEAYLPCMHQDIAKTCDNIGRLYNTTGDNLAKSPHFQEAHKIRQKLLSYSHPYVAKTCCNVGEPYRSKKSCRHVSFNCSKSFKHQFVYLASHRFKPVTTDTVTYVMEKPIRNRSEMTCYLETALNTHRATCRFNKSGLMITSESNVGFHPSENNLNLSHYDESTIKLSTNNLASNNLLARTFNNTVASVSEDTNKYPNSFSFFEKVLEIYRKSLTPNHPDSTDPYDNTGSVYSNTGEYSKALSYYKKALEIRQKTLTANHPDLAASYSNIGSVYSNTGEYSKALSYYEKALEIRQKTPSASHLDLAAFYSNIGSVYSNMGEYSKALSYYEKALEIRQDSRFLNRFRHTQVRNDIDCTTNETYKT
jgi:tetratricopeptide (TPR) repeat protein